MPDNHYIEMHHSLSWHFDQGGGARYSPRHAVKATSTLPGHVSEIERRSSGNAGCNAGSIVISYIFESKPKCSAAMIPYHGDGRMQHTHILAAHKPVPVTKHQPQIFMNATAQRASYSDM